MPQKTPKIPRNVKSSPASTVDEHEKGKNFLTEAEFEQLLDGTKLARHRLRDATILLLMFRHGLRVSELCDLRRQDLDLKSARLWVERKKGGLSTEQPVAGDTLRYLRRYLKERTDHLPWLVVNERSSQFARHGINYIIKRAGLDAGFDFHVHPHMLRHSCGYALANRGMDARLIQDYLGHRDPSHTAKYTRTAAGRFEGVWRKK